MKGKLFVFGLILMLFLGLIYAWSLFAAPLELVFGWTRSQTSATFSISMISFCLGAITSGQLLKRQPLSRVLALCGFIFFLGFYWASKITKIHELYLSYGLICGFGVGMGYNCLLASIPPLFGHRVGLASGGLLMAMGLGSLLLGSLTERLIGLIGISQSFRILALIFFAIFIILSRFMILPEVGRDLVVNKEDMSRQEMIRTRDFWLIFIWSSLIAINGLALVSNASFVALEAGISGGLLSLAVGVLSLGNGVGRLVFGKLSDLIGGKKSMLLSSIIYLIAGLLLKTSVSFLLFIGFILVGLSCGSSSVVSAYLVKKKYGDSYYAENLSAVVLVLIPASLIGPRLASGIYLAKGTYAALFSLIIVLGLISALPALFLDE